VAEATTIARREKTRGAGICPQKSATFNVNVSNFDRFDVDPSPDSILQISEKTIFNIQANVLIVLEARARSAVESVGSAGFSRGSKKNQQKRAHPKNG
jgi:hypothetical protein